MNERKSLKLAIKKHRDHIRLFFPKRNDPAIGHVYRSHTKMNLTFLRNAVKNLIKLQYNLEEKDAA